MTPGRATGALAIVFALVATTYSLIVPVLEAPDEPPHFLYVSQLIQGRGLPVLTPDGKNNVAGQEGVQPPLYYLLGAAASFWTDPRDFAEWQLTNWHQNVDRSRPGNKNLIVHTERERFPFTGAILSIHVVRLVSVALGTATVVLTYLIGRAAGLRGWLAFSAAAFIAFNPQFVFISSVVNNDNVGITLSALALLLSLRLWMPIPDPSRDQRERVPDTPTFHLPSSTFDKPESRPTRAALIALGAVAGLAALGKLSGLIILPLVLAAWWLARPRARRFRIAGEDLSELALILVPFALVAGWWYLRNFAIYGDPVGWARMMTDIDPIVRRVFRWEDIGAELIALKESSWAVFGWRNIAVDGWIYRLLDVTTLMALLGTIVAFRIRPVGDRPSGSAAALLGLWILGYSVSLARWISLVEHTGQGRLIFPALPAIAVLFVTGLAALWSGRANRSKPSPASRLPSPLLVLALGGLAMLTSVSPWRYILPAYPPVRYLSEREADSLGTPLRARFATVAELISYRFEPETVSAGVDAWLILAWRAIEPTSDDLNVNLRVLAHDFRPILEEATYPALGAHPFVRWRPGEIVEDRRLLRLPAGIAGPDYLRVELSIRPRERINERLTIRDSQNGEAGDRITLGPLRLAPGTPWPPASATRIAPVAVAGHQVIGSFVERTGPGEADGLTVFVYWVAGSSIGDRPVAISLIGPSGSSVTQSTMVPGAGWFPMSAWRPGDQFEDERDLALPAGLQSGEYRLLLAAEGAMAVEIGRVRLP